MKTPVEKMIEAVENGYYSNETLWNEWKKTLLEEERELLQHNVINSEAELPCTHEIRSRDYKCAACGHLLIIEDE